MAAVAPHSEPDAGRNSQYVATGESGAAESSVDLLCVGFGLSSVAIAAALADRNLDGRICILDRQSSFSWGPANTLPENKIQTPFLRDLVSMRNPRSRFTFINYLHSTNQLVAYTNASSLYPSKLIMSQYLAWAAGQIEELGWVSYRCEVIAIDAVKQGSGVSGFAVSYRNITTGKCLVVHSKRVVVATGSAPLIPQVLSTPELASHVIHSAFSNEVFESKGPRMPDVAVVGGSQEGAEVFEELQAHYGGHRATLFIEDSALRPVDNTAFSQVLTDVPSAGLTEFPPELRKRLLGSQTQYQSPISLELIEQLYDNDYTQKIREKDPSKWRFAIEPLAQVIGAEVVGPRVRLHLKNPRTGAVRKSERSFDVVIAATGYQKEAETLLSSISPLLTGGAVSVGRDYRVNFKENTLQSGCGLYSLGALADHSSRDEVFMYLAEQGQRIADSVINLLQEEETKQVAQFEARL